MEDKIIECQNCKQDFVWTAGEQEFYAERNLEEPKYCMICRGMFGEASKDGFRGTIKTSDK